MQSFIGEQFKLGIHFRRLLVGLASIKISYRENFWQSKNKIVASNTSLATTAEALMGLTIWLFVWEKESALEVGKNKTEMAPNESSEIAEQVLFFQLRLLK